MPVEIIYLGVVFVVAIIGFSILKRPLYECMLASFVALVAVTGTWADVGTFIWDAMNESSLYVIIVFVTSATLLGETTIIDDCISIILSIFGRLRGGAGFVAIIGSTYMGSLSGSGPGNVATTGVFTIPAMKKSGFPPHLAANVEAHASTMGNMIPPAGMIAVAFAVLDGMYPNTYTMSQYWMVLWGIALVFVIQRIITLYLMCLYYKVEPMDKDDLPSLKESLAKGWKSIFLPVIVFLPFFLTNNYGDFFTAHLGAGASAFSNSILLFIPSLIVVFGIVLSDKETRRKMNMKNMYDVVCESMTTVVPTSALVMFSYFVSNVFETINVGPAIGEFISSMNLPYIALALVLPLFTAVLGMLIPGSTQVKIFGGIIIAVMAAAGGDPLLICAMLPCICGAMHGVTPPYCACVYTAMGIAESELKPTLVNCMIWIGVHYALSVITLLGVIPILGM